MRTEPQASSMRRSQDESYRGRSEYRGYRGGGYGADKRGSFGSRLRDRLQSDSYPFRKTVSSSFRGRFTSSRSIGRSRGGRISRGFRSDTTSLTSRKLAALGGLLNRTEEDLRRLRMSSAIKR
ncbi:hypothetical protein LSTR_LSTR014234 [Laodelphax striatellus]|uniref:Uncharacterized protein n=1 Tax=Laodelphax striatellus TaxID=195883 RepID=A0A482X7J1_LAOST|nr:hypothetical protein LSTR_LSTR014234 [Laodelphax striatellus]